MTQGSKPISVNGPMSNSEVLNTSLKFNEDDFLVLHGKIAQLLLEATEQLKSQLPSIFAEHSLKDIYNHDKTGIFFWAIPLRSFV